VTEKRKERKEGEESTGEEKERGHNNTLARIGKVG